MRLLRIVFLLAVIVACFWLAVTAQADAGYMLASCKLDAAEHEKQEGYFNCGKFSISVPPQGIPADVLRQHVGKDVEIVIRLRQPRTLETVIR
jgi:hypothetical protein